MAKCYKGKVSRKDKQQTKTQEASSAPESAQAAPVNGERANDAKGHPAQ